MTNLITNLQSNIVPVWDNPLIASDGTQRDAYALHYLVENTMPLDNHYAKIAELVESANKKSVNYTFVYLYVCNDYAKPLTYEIAARGIKSHLVLRPKVVPLKVIHLSKASSEFEANTQNTEALGVIIPYMLRQIKRMAHPPVTLKRWLINLEGHVEPICAIIAHPEERSNQLIRIHMIYAPNTIDSTTPLDILGTTMRYDPMEVSGV